MSQVFKIPDLGGAKDLDVIEITVAEGDQVEAEQTLLVLESDKASLEIPAEAAGKVRRIHVNIGDKINEGDDFIELSDTDTDGTAEIKNKSTDDDKKQAEPAAEDVVEDTQVKDASVAAAEVTVDMRVPDLGGSKDVDVIEVLVAKDDQLECEQPIIVLETDKATMEIPAEQAGRILELNVSVGDKVNQGDLMLTLLTSASIDDDTKQEAPRQVEQNASTATAKQPSSATVMTSHDSSVHQATNAVHAGPSVRKLARELGVDLSQVSGTGIKGRVTKSDVQQFVKQRLNTQASGGSAIPAVPSVDFSQFGPVSTQPLNNVKKSTAKAMTRAWLNVPQVTQFDQADITELEAYRKSQNQYYAKQDIKFSIVPFVLKTMAKVLKEFPTFNASLSGDGESLILKDYVHIGVAVDTPKGLLVPVIRDVDTLSIIDLTRELNNKATLARSGSLPLKDMQGACMSLSSLGGIGGTAFTPIVNPPEVAILGLSKASMQPQWDGKAFEPRLMLPLSLSYDHRVIDGAEAARFGQRLVQCLQDLRNLLM